MKKTFLILGCCALLAGCGSNERADGYDKAYDSNAVAEEEKGIAPAPSAEEATDAAAPAEADAGVADNAEAAATTDGADKEAAQSESFEKGESLIASSDCLSCHQIDKKLVGPAYKDVAKKYEATEKNIDYLSSKIIQGGAGVWGQIPMTPHPDLSKENASEMVKYILSLNN
ncbi:c-type cytochrome [Pontibacter sp. 172403-2]|uniref:c-type cytochrome n=1 Tax=Pontibacter rufus TaxID=2791028 RepID=UPI0018AFD7C0|nr:c-type cytochrome [Pontibacter sp. 172403-2]MBF9254337.1 c-type cytochrome [Pontibacter sp. 172403-2]